MYEVTYVGGNKKYLSSLEYDEWWEDIDAVGSHRVVSSDGDVNIYYAEIDDVWYRYIPATNNLLHPQSTRINTADTIKCILEMFKP